jgi:curved DNA-binding protein CbpA
MNPFLVLDVPPEATDEQVRASYQKLLRRHPPEQHPERFQMIQEAYQALRTQRDRKGWWLFHMNESEPGVAETVEAFARIPGRTKPPGAAAFRSFMQSCGNTAMRSLNPGNPTKSQP